MRLCDFLGLTAFNISLKVIKGVVRPAGFEPASAAWKAAILNQARLWPLSTLTIPCGFKDIVTVQRCVRLIIHPGALQDGQIVLGVGVDDRK